MQEIDFSDNEQIQQSKKLINANSTIMISWNKISMIQQSKTITYLLDKIKGDNSSDAELGLFLLNKMVLSSKHDITN